MSPSEWCPTCPGPIDGPHESYCDGGDAIPRKRLENRGYELGAAIVENKRMRAAIRRAIEEIDRNPAAGAIRLRMALVDAIES